MEEFTLLHRAFIKQGKGFSVYRSLLSTTEKEKTMTQYKVRFDLRAGKLEPMLVDHVQPNRLNIRRDDTFKDEIREGAMFIATLVSMNGPARAPKSMELALESKVKELSSAGFGNEFWARPEHLRLIEADIKFGRAIRLVGPKGTGKTTFAALLAKRLSAPFIKVDGTGIFKPKDLFGAETGSEGTLRWNPSALSLFLGEHRLSERNVKGVICLDEFSRMGHSMAPFHALFDHTHQFSFTTCDGTIVIDRLDGFVFILTDNPAGSGYVGNQELDAAMDDRVESYEFAYPPSEWEIPWLQSQTGISTMDATRIVMVANEARQLAVTQGWSKGGPSPRRTLCVAQDVSSGVDFELSVAYRIVLRYENGGVNSERGILIEKLRTKKIHLGQFAQDVNASPLLQVA